MDRRTTFKRKRLIAALAEGEADAKAGRLTQIRNEHELKVFFARLAEPLSPSDAPGARP